MSAVGLLCPFHHRASSLPPLQFYRASYSHRISFRPPFSRLNLPLWTLCCRRHLSSISTILASNKTESYKEEDDFEDEEDEEEEDEDEEDDAEFEDLEHHTEKDWSFLESDRRSSQVEWKRKTERIISAGGINPTSRVLVSFGSSDFVDRMVESRPCEFAVVVHQSFSVLSQIKEKHDALRCWKGDLVHVPWDPFDCVFLCCLPALKLKLKLLFPSLDRLCSQGAKVVISSCHGRKGVEEQRVRHPDVILSSLPTREDLQKSCELHSFELTEFEDDPSFYLAVFVFNKGTAPN